MILAYCQIRAVLNCFVFSCLSRSMRQMHLNIFHVSIEHVAVFGRALYFLGEFQEGSSLFTVLLFWLVPTSTLLTLKTVTTSAVLVISDLQTHIVVFGKGLAQSKGQNNEDQVHNAHRNGHDDQFTLPNQPLGKHLIAALKQQTTLITNSYLCSYLIAYLLVETVAVAGVGCTVLVAWHQLGHILKDTAGIGNGAVTLAVHPRWRGIKIVIVIDATAPKVAHQLVPHQ